VGVFSVPLQQMFTILGVHITNGNIFLISEGLPVAKKDEKKEQ